MQKPCKNVRWFQKHVLSTLKVPATSMVEVCKKALVDHSHISQSCYHKYHSIKFFERTASRFLPLAALIDASVWSNTTVAVCHLSMTSYCKFEMNSSSPFRVSEGLLPSDEEDIMFSSLEGNPVMYESSEALNADAAAAMMT